MHYLYMTGLQTCLSCSREILVSQTVPNHTDGISKCTLSLTQSQNSSPTMNHMHTEVSSPECLAVGSCYCIRKFIKGIKADPTSTEGKKWGVPMKVLAVETEYCLTCCICRLYRVVCTIIYGGPEGRPLRTFPRERRTSPRERRTSNVERPLANVERRTLPLYVYPACACLCTNAYRKWAVLFCTNSVLVTVTPAPARASR